MGIINMLSWKMWWIVWIEYIHLIQHRNIFAPVAKWPEKVWMNKKSMLRTFHIFNPWTWTCFVIDVLTNAQGERGKGLKKPNHSIINASHLTCDSEWYAVNLSNADWTFRWISGLLRVSSAQVLNFTIYFWIEHFAVVWVLSVYCIRNSKASYGNPLLWLHNCVTTHKAPNEINIKGTNKRTTKLSHFQPLNGMDGCFVDFIACYWKFRRCVRVRVWLCVRAHSCMHSIFCSYFKNKLEKIELNGRCKCGQKSITPKWYASMFLMFFFLCLFIFLCRRMNQSNQSNQFFHAPLKIPISDTCTAFSCALKFWGNNYTVLFGRPF